MAIAMGIENTASFTLPAIKTAVETAVEPSAPSLLLFSLEVMRIMEVGCRLKFFKLFYPIKF